MPPTARLLLVLAVVAMLVAARIVAVRWRRSVQRERHPSPALPAELVAGADRTWVVFTTPYCASCGPVKERLAASDPEARVLTVDVTRDPALAEAFDVRSAPTAVLAGANGQVQARLVGAAAVTGWLARHDALDGDQVLSP